MLVFYPCGREIKVFMVRAGMVLDFDKMDEWEPNAYDLYNSGMKKDDLNEILLAGGLRAVRGTKLEMAKHIVRRFDAIKAHVLAQNVDADVASSSHSQESLQD